MPRGARYVRPFPLPLAAHVGPIELPAAIPLPIIFGQVSCNLLWCCLVIFLLWMLCPSAFIIHSRQQGCITFVRQWLCQVEVCPQRQQGLQRLGGWAPGAGTPIRAPPRPTPGGGGRKGVGGGGGPPPNPQFRLFPCDLVRPASQKATQAALHASKSEPEVSGPFSFSAAAPDQANFAELELVWLVLCVPTPSKGGGHLG